MINILNKENCCGCSACINSCPKLAISMIADAEGFLYPNIDQSECVDCGICEKVCPILNPQKHIEGPSAYVLQHNDSDILSESTSGGAFSAIAQYVEEYNGIIVGAVFDDNFTIVHKDFDNSSWGEIRNSKYAQSYLGDIFQRIKSNLLKGKKVLFTGTPCQVAGLKKYLKKDYENLITIDIVCRSIPSPMLWEKYLEHLEKKNKSKIKSVKFRNKTYGYHSGTFIAAFQNGHEESSSNRTNPYMKAFHMNICSRPSCYQCKFKTVNRASDFTIFDCWNPTALVKEREETIDFTDNDNGYSAVLVHTEKGKQILQYLHKNVTIYEVDATQALMYTGGMAVNSVERPAERDDFYDSLCKYGFAKTAKKYVPIKASDRGIEWLKKWFYKSGILKRIISKRRMK